jgi:hypothetical protein
MIGLLRAEIIKVAGRRLWWVMTAILLLLMAGIAFLFTVLPGISPEEFEGMPTLTKPDAYTFGAAQAIGQTWFPLVFAAVLLAGETSTSVWAASLTRESRRWMHLIAKLAVVSVAATVAVLIALAGWSTVVTFFAEGSGVPGLGVWADVLWKTALTEGTWVALGLGTVAVFRAMGPAIGAALGFSFLDSILALWAPWREVSLTVASGRLVSDLEMTGMGSISASQMGPTQALLVVFAWAGFGLLLGLIGLQVRDP